MAPPDAARDAVAGIFLGDDQRRARVDGVEAIEILDARFDERRQAW